MLNLKEAERERDGKGASNIHKERNSLTGTRTRLVLRVSRSLLLQLDSEDTKLLILKDIIRSFLLLRLTGGESS